MQGSSPDISACMSPHHVFLIEVFLLCRQFADVIQFLKWYYSTKIVFSSLIASMSKYVYELTVLLVIFYETLYTFYLGMLIRVEDRLFDESIS